MKASMDPKKKLRLNKFLAQHGIASRRTIDKWIAEGRISIDGKKVKELGYHIDQFEEICVDGVPLDIEKQQLDTLAFYKPVSVVSTMSDPERRPCISDFLLEYDQRLFPVGRLDYDAEGLMLLTNDGELANKLAHPRYGKRKVYEVKVKGHPSPLHLNKLAAGVKLDDGMAYAKSVELIRKASANAWVKMTLTEGRHHQIKRMWEALGFRVLKILRTQFGPIKLSKMKPGEIRRIRGPEMSQLLKEKDV